MTTPFPEHPIQINTHSRLAYLWLLNSYVSVSFLVNPITEPVREVYQSVSSKNNGHDGFRELLVSSRIGEHLGHLGKKTGLTDIAGTSDSGDGRV